MSRERAMHWLLLAYPPALRRDHGAEILQAVSETWRAQHGVLPRLRLVGHLIKDLVASWMRPGRRDRQPPRRRRSGSRGRFVADLRDTRRLFTRSPLFAAGAVGTLALGIGGVTAVFSLAQATILRPFTFPDPDGIARVKFSWSQPDFRDLVTQAQTFAVTAAWSDEAFAISTGTESLTVNGAAVSGQFFDLVGLAPVRGKLIGDADDRPGAANIAVLSERLWRRQFGADAAVVGSTIRINQQPVTIVGISPASFRGLSLTQAPELFVPLMTLKSLGTGFVVRMFDRRGAVWLEVVGRLRPGVTMAAAAADVDRVYRQLHPAKPGAPPEPVEVESLLDRVLGKKSDLSRFVWTLGGTTLVSLLLACATVATLLMMRAERRRRELAVRVALGAGRGQIRRMLLVESLAIGLAGGVAGAFVAQLALPLLAAFALPGGVAIRDLRVAVDPIALAVAVGLGGVTSLIFGLAPLWQGGRLDLIAAVREGSRGSARQPLRTALVTVQIAVCTLLLAGSLAFSRALQFGLAVDRGFDTERPVLVTVDPSLAKYDAKQIGLLQERTLDAFGAQPWVSAAGWTGLLPLRGRMTWNIALKGQPARAGSKTMGVDANVVSPGYFEALGLPIVAGRSFTRTDTAGTPAVAIVSEGLARRWPDGRALGGEITDDPDVPSPAWLTVVGIVKDMRRTLSRDADPTLYVPAAQSPQMLDFAGSHLVVRSSLAPDAALDATTRTLRDVDANLPITAKATMADHLSGSLMSQRLGATLFTLFASVALTLTALGLYGVIAYAVAHRAREIGIRRALGADRASVLRLVGRQGMTPIAAGLVTGGVASVWAGRAVEQFLFKLPAVSVGAFAAVAAIVAAIAALAMIVPARRALSVDPAATLRNE